MNSIKDQSHKSWLWLRKNLFNNAWSGITTVVIVLGLFKFGFPLFNWAIWDSSFGNNAEECRTAGGACWAFIREKARFILLGSYPRAEQWRPIVFILLFITLFALSQFHRFWNKKFLVAWIAFPFLAILLMKGGIMGLPLIDSEDWSGLPLTLILSFLGIAFSYPLGILLALGRRSELPVVKTICVTYIEFIRGVPLISVLFVATLMLPLFLPEGMTFAKFLRAQLAIIVFASAYMAEVVRGGLQGIPKGQYEAAKAIGLGYWKTMILVILPQALRMVIPPTVNTFIGLFKDTSLVFIISMSDLMFNMKAAFNDTEWLGFSVEGYIFVALVYFIFCYLMGQISQKIELKLAR